MRLIDADNNNLRNAIWKAKLDTREKINGLLDYAPTVKAISVDWLKKFANERTKNEDEEGYWHDWGTDLLQMIELWEKENES